MKISSWNVNSVRARISNILTYIKENKPDILYYKKLKHRKRIFHMKISKTKVMNVTYLVKKVTMALQ